MQTFSYTFKPPFYLKNPHIQTTYATLFRKPIELAIQKEIFEFEDGDFVQTYYLWHHNKNAPIVVLFHGLAGSYHSPYIQGMMAQLNTQGFHCVLMHFRGCGDLPNRLPRSYHSGETQDATTFINFLATTYKPPKLFAIGYSLGANMLLKLLGEQQNTTPLDGAIAVSPPLKLDLCADAINRGFSRYYQYRLVQDLKLALKQKYQLFDMNKYISLKEEDIEKISTFWEFDEAYTAPIHGFRSAQEYYTKCSSFQFLQKITKPTLLIHAKDDPFMTPEILPNTQQLSSSITFALQEHGGHVGFVQGGEIPYWLEETLTHFLRSLL
jgi:predicted alpha/beta-fold hydrolase